jgi:hypothetical protein
MTAKPFLTEVAVNIGLNSLVNKQYAECSGGVFSLTRAGLDAYNQIEGLN